VVHVGSRATPPITRAALFRKGATTDMLARFSTGAGEMGSRDPMKCPHFIRSQKRLPDSGLRDNHMPSQRTRWRT